MNAMNAIYKWRTGMKFIGDAYEIAEHLENLAEEKGGGLTTDEIVADAMSESSPLHPNIEKDDKVAAHQWRKHQVRGLVGALVRVTIEGAPNDGEREIRIRAMPHVDGLYRPSEAVITDTQLHDMYKKKLYQDLQRTRQRISSYDEFSSVVSAIDKLNMKQLEG